MADALQQRIKHLRIMAESAKRRSTIYSGISDLDDKPYVITLALQFSIIFLE